jgi:hypothetical protein
MRLLALVSILILNLGCTSNSSFQLKPAQFGEGESGYFEVVAQDGSITLTVYTLGKHTSVVLEHNFHKRVAQVCGGYKYTMISFHELIDICSSGGCFKTAVQGRFKCT